MGNGAPVSASPVTSLIERHGSTKAVFALAAYETGVKLYNQGKETWRTRLAYTVTVSSKDPLYGEIHDWILSVVPTEKHRSISISSSSRLSNEDSAQPVSESNPEAVVVPPLTVRFNDSNSRVVLLNGHKIRVKVRLPEMNPNLTLLDRETPDSKIIFTAATYLGQRAVIDRLEELNRQRGTSRKAVLKMVSRWGDWRSRSDLPPRTLDSVVLPEDQMQRIIDDLDIFLKSEERYNRLAISWHRGYMFHGPPGTGKTSLIKALANHFNLDLWYISLSDLKAEASLLDLLASVGTRSILLLEDIDTMQLTHDGNSSEQGSISIGSLINALDGVATPHGLITMMTTNHFEVLDERLKRSGRMDRVEELGYPSSKTIATLYKHFYGRLPNWYEFSDNCPIPELSTSTVAEVFKRHMSDPNSAETEIKKMMKQDR